MQCNAMQCNAMQCNAICNAICNAMQRNATQCNMQCNAMQCYMQYAMQCNSMQCNAMQCIAMQRNATQYAMQCNMQCSMQCNAICNATQCAMHTHALLTHVLAGGSMYVSRQYMSVHCVLHCIHETAVHANTRNIYRVAKTHRMPYLYSRTTHDADAHSALKRCARGLECTQHSVHSKS